MSEKYKKTCKYLNYVENLLFLASTVTDCISISVFGSLVAIPVGIRSSAVGIKICETTAGIKKYMSIIKKKKKKHDKIVLLVKFELNGIDVLISKVSINSYIGHDKSVSVNIFFSKFFILFYKFYTKWNNEILTQVIKITQYIQLNI